MTEDRSRAAMLRLPTASLAVLHRLLSQDRSPAEAAQLARQLGFETGEAFHTALQESLPQDGSAAVPELPAQTFWDRLGEFFAELGWGELRFEPLHAGVVSLASGQWAEAEGRSSGQPTCHVTTGLLADLLSRVAGTDLAVLEVECRASGQEQCRFLVGGVEALGGVYDQLRQGRSYTEALSQLA